MSGNKVVQESASREDARNAARLQKPSLKEMAILFGRVGGLTFGGGNPTTVALQIELVERFSWIDQTEFAVCYAFSRLAPGTNLLAFCTATGWIIRKWPGALIALLAASLPSSALAVLFTYLYGSLSGNHIVAIAIRGMLASAVGILVASSWELVRPYVSATTWLRPALLIVGSLLLSVRFKMAPIPVLFLSALVGVTWQREKRRNVDA